MGISNTIRPAGLGARQALWIGAAALFMLPVIASLLTQEMAWSIGDFALFAAMLLGVCGSYEMAMLLSDHRAYRLGFALTLFGVFVLVFANLAVGIIGSENNPANLIFFAIPLAGVLGALISRFKARGLSRTLYVMASMQVLAAPLFGSGDLVFAVFVSAMFTAIWLAAAAAFHWAAREARAA